MRKPALQLIYVQYIYSSMKNAKLFRLKIRQDFLLPGGIYMDNSSNKTFQGVSNFRTFLLTGDLPMVVVVVLVVVGESVDVGVDVAACSNSPPHGLVAKHFDPPSSHWQHPAW